MEWFSAFPFWETLTPQWPCLAPRLLYSSPRLPPDGIWTILPLKAGMGLTLGLIRPSTVIGSLSAIGRPGSAQRPNPQLYSPNTPIKDQSLFNPYTSISLPLLWATTLDHFPSGVPWISIRSLTACILVPGATIESVKRGLLVSMHFYPSHNPNGSQNAAP